MKGPAKNSWTFFHCFTIYRQGDDIFDALYYTSVNGGLGMRRAMWGEDGVMDFHKPYEDSDDNIWIYGEGIHAELEP